jgi:hypothetical protein
MAWFFELKNPYTYNRLSVFYHEKIGSEKDLENWRFKSLHNIGPKQCWVGIKKIGS